MKRLFTGIVQTRGFGVTGVNSKYFDKILVANRGEIAVRVIETARKCGIETVAVYSDADANAKFVKLADEAYYIGSNDVTESYNNIDTIIRAIKDTGAQAVHPGYGFLAENDEFSARCEAEGINFIGPPPYAISSMGDKIVSKKIAENAGVNVIPGFDGEVMDVEHALEVSHDLGYPVMLKASAGGGGKGMRVCFNDEEVIEGWDLCKAEAKNFANDKMLVEKFIDNPRHVEIQVLGDKHGNYVYFNERECSIQRRQQKVVEEAPCSIMTPETRRAMGEQACALARQVDYCSAGTVEMMVSEQDDGQLFFYFLEMNTRLQVEHPVTEMTTGFDLVEEMLSVAAGEPLRMVQDDIGINGWSTECRVYAEDPMKDFAPAIGLLEMYQEPGAQDGTIRTDSGILEKDEISVFFDPMICKLISWGKDRQESIDRMIEALDEYVIYGAKVKHNVNFLRDVLDHPRYRSGRMTTNFILEEYPEGFQGIVLTEEDKKEMVAAAAYAEFMKVLKDSRTSGALPSFKPPKSLDLVVSFDEESFPVTVTEKDECVKIEYEDGTASCLKTDWTLGAPLMYLDLDGESRAFQIFDHDVFHMVMQHRGTRFDVNVRTVAQEDLFPLMPFHPPPDLSKIVIAEMAGQIIAVNVGVGDFVEEGDFVMVMEAMKMQNRLLAPKTGVIAAVHVVPGDVVENDQILIEFEEDEDEE